MTFQDDLKAMPSTLAKLVDMYAQDGFMALEPLIEFELEKVKQTFPLHVYQDYKFIYRTIKQGYETGDKTRYIKKFDY